MADNCYVGHLDASQILQAQTDSHSFWGGGTPLPDRIARLERLLEQAGPSRFRVCGLIDTSGAVVASAKLYELELRLNGFVTPSVGIGAVFTPERCRGRGHASELLQSIAADVTQSGSKALLLFSDITPAFYERLGYITFPASNWTCEAKSLPSDKPFSTRLATSADAEALREMYESNWPREISRPHRDTFRWSFFRDVNRAEPDLVLLDHNKTIGYLSARIGKSSIWVDEYVIPAADLPRLWATIRNLAEESRATEVRGWYNLEPLADHFRLQQRDAAIPMLKFLDPTLANQKIDPHRSHFGSLDHF